MRTDTLIETLVADAGRRRTVKPPPWPLLAGLAACLAALVFFTAIGFRPDIDRAAHTVRFDFKFVAAAALAATAFSALRSLAHPGAKGARAMLWLVLPAALLALSVVAELLVVSPDLWESRLIGQNGMNCLTAIPAMGAPVLIVFLWALKSRAPTEPVLSGAVAGLSAAAFAAFLYAAQCTDDSPLFVAFWYPIATLVLVAAGAFAGHRLLRW